MRLLVPTLTSGPVLPMTPLMVMSPPGLSGLTLLLPMLVLAAPSVTGPEAVAGVALVLISAARALGPAPRFATPVPLIVSGSAVL